MRGHTLMIWMLAAVAGALMIVASSATAAIAATPAFDEARSLTGSCKVSELDPVPDPGCPAGGHPSAPFSRPSAIATDAYGNVYVANSSFTESGRIDVFDPKGNFITEVSAPRRPMSLAVDSEGNLYAANLEGDEHEEGVLRYEPTTYEPAKAEVEYGSPPVTVLQKTESGGLAGLAVNPFNDRLFVKFSGFVSLYKSAVEGNEFVESFANALLPGVVPDAVGIAVDAAHGRLYISAHNVSACPCVYALELAPPHNLLWEIQGSSVPSGKFVSTYFSVAADEGNGDLYVYDGEAHKVYRFKTSNTGASYQATIEHGFQYVLGSKIGIDNGKHSPNGAENLKGRYLYVPSEAGGKGGATGHSYAFGPPTKCAPQVEAVSFANVGEVEAELQAEIEPCGLETHYAFQYIVEQQFEEEGESYAAAAVAGEGEIPAGNTPVSVSATAIGLEPGTTYRFRTLAENEAGSDAGEGTFETYPATEVGGSCPNQALRRGPSALLPDCRAFELVTPPATDARPPRGTGSGTGSTIGSFFDAPAASPTGDAASFEIEGGSLPGAEATGSLNGDPYLARRGAVGWSTGYTGPSGSEATSVNPGSSSPDQGYSFWVAVGDGSALVGGNETTYVRYPDGNAALVGRGTIAQDPLAKGRLISEGGGHIVFDSGDTGTAIKLTEDAPPNGTKAIYDRTANEVVHVVSLLPGDITPAAGENATYLGASRDGRGVAFQIGGKLYLRYEDEETYEIGAGLAFEGIAEGGSRVFYLEGGNLWRLDVKTDERTPFTTTGDVTPVNVSADGSTAYFLSPTALPGVENPLGAEPAPGKENLYRSTEGTIGFLGTVTAEDVLGEETGIGLGLWAPDVASRGWVARDPSRTTPNGDSMLFESRAPLTAYDPEGHVEVYRYDAVANELACLSCNPTLARAAGEASLESVALEFGDPEPLGPFARIENLSADGGRAIFQSTEALVPADTDGLQDVYEWEAAGVGSCERPQGCLYLISSGHSRQPDYLYSVSDGGSDVFFRSGDLLLPSDLEETPSIYDARVNGGFPEPEPLICEGEGCRPGMSPAPAPPNLGSRGGTTEVPRHHPCPKGQYRVRRRGKVHCVKKHHRRHRRASADKMGGRK